MKKSANRLEPYRTTALCAIVYLATCSISVIARGQDAPPPIPEQEQPEVLTRGPVHEAYAEPVNMQTDDSEVAPTQPPPNIEETPPDERPEGDQFQWIPGYWSWDAEGHNYIWVSACWRAAPPKMSWTPGYWSQTTGGWEWVAGYWAPQDSQEIDYLPAPPVPDSVEPPGPPPSVDQVWVPPCPYWTNDQYVERPGYWLASQPDWMWVASHYVWTPRGYVFCAGHWDYPLADRGVLFAPVAIPQADYSRPGYVYTPSVVVSTDVLSANLFVSFRYSHYFFGDYYDDAAQIGVVSWCDRPASKTWYDPMFEYDRASLRISVTDWDQRERHEFEQRRADKDLRPPRTYRDLEARIAKAPPQQRQNITIVQSLKTVVNKTTVNNTTINDNRTTVNNNRTTVNQARTSKIKFQKIDKTAQANIAKQAVDQRKVEEQRKAREVAAAPDKAAVKQATPQLAGQRREPATPAAPAPAERGRGAANTARPEAAPAPAPAARDRGSESNARPEATPAPTPTERGRGSENNPRPEATRAPAPAARGGESENAARPEATPAERGPGAAQPAANAQPAERGRGGANSEVAPAARKPGAAQREVRAQQPDKVKLSDNPPRAKAASAGRGAPPEPSDEAGRKGDGKDKQPPKAEEKPTSRPAARGGR